jgi:hypothetical protein
MVMSCPQNNATTYNSQYTLCRGEDHATLGSRRASGPGFHRRVRYGGFGSTSRCNASISSFVYGIRGRSPLARAPCRGASTCRHLYDWTLPGHTTCRLRLTWLMGFPGHTTCRLRLTGLDWTMWQSIKIKMKL